MSAWDKLSICFDFNVTCQPVFDNALKLYTKDSYLYLVYSYGDIRLYRLHLTDELTSFRVSSLSTPLLYFYHNMYETKTRAKLMDLYYC